MNKLLNVSSSPHVRCSVDTQSLMLDVAIAMLPAAAFGVYNFGFHALFVILATVAACIASEYVYEKLMHRPITIMDGSALVTGMILALNMPPEIPVWIPVTYIATLAVFVFIFGGFDANYVLAQVCGGGLIFGAFFMATDYVTSPITPMGQIVFGIMLGLLTGIFRLWGASPEGVSYAIILCNLFVPMIERVTLPKAFGKEAKKA